MTKKKARKKQHCKKPFSLRIKFNGTVGIDDCFPEMRTTHGLAIEERKGGESG